MTHKKLAEVFDVEAVKVPLPEIITQDTDDIDSDAQYAIDNSKKLIETGMEALETMNQVAIDSESPRAYEVLTNMIKTIADMNAQLIDLHNAKKRAKEPSKSAQLQNMPGSVTNNTAVFVGTTTELNKLISERLNSK